MTAHEADIIPFPERRPRPADEVTALMADLAYHEYTIENHLRASEQIREELARLGIKTLDGEQSND